MWVGLTVAFQKRCLHVSLQYFKPWRPTFLELIPDASDERQLKELSLLAEQPGAPQYITCGMMQRDRSTLSFLSHMQFVSSLDMSLHWRVRIGLLSVRECHFPNSAARVRILMEEEEFVVWRGEQVRARRAQGRRVMGGVLAEVGNDGVRDGQGDDAGGSDEAGDDQGEDGELDDEDANMHEEDEEDDAGYPDDLLDMLGVPPEAVPPELAAVEPSSVPESPSSSTTSSRSRSSSSSSSSDHRRQDPEVERVEHQRPAAVANAVVDDVLPRSRLAQSGPWGQAFYFTLRPLHPGSTTAGSWVVVCKHHSAAGQTARCTKSKAFGNEEESIRAKKALKLWCLTAGDHETKESHCGARGLPAYSAEELGIADDELDARLAAMPPLAV